MPVALARSGQRTPQPPQLFTSLDVLRQTPLQGQKPRNEPQAQNGGNRNGNQAGDRRRADAERGRAAPIGRAIGVLAAAEGKGGGKGEGGEQAQWASS